MKSREHALYQVLNEKDCRIAELEASLAKADRQVQVMAGVIREAMVYVTEPTTLEKMKAVSDGI